MPLHTMLVGLTSEEAKRRLAESGPNEIQEKRENLILKILRSFVSPITFMLLAASLLSFAAGRVFDFYFILALLGLNVAVSLWHEWKTDTAIEELRAKLSVSANVLRDDAWQEVNSKLLVPGDVVECAVGNLVPADITIAEAKNLQINEAVLTGESLPKEKRVGEVAYSGSSMFAGTLQGTVSATGSKTFFGKIVGSVEVSGRRSAMERDILSITKFLMFASLLAVLLLTAALLHEHKPLIDIILLDLSLLIAGLPVSLPTVMTLIVSLGASLLAQKDALVRRLAALEDLANINLLLTDKTGTLTESTITLERVKAYAPYNEDEVLRLAAAGITQSDRDLIDRAVAAGAKVRGLSPAALALDFVPGDSARKRSTVLAPAEDGQTLASVGMPPIIMELCALDADSAARIIEDVDAAAVGGSRVLAVAIKERAAGIADEQAMHFAGLIVLSDPLRADAPEVVQFLEDMGVEVKMMTGDTKETARRIAGELKLKGSVIGGKEAGIAALTPEALRGVGTFAEVFPGDKLALVTTAQKEWVVAVTGDGVNDLPAIRQADVGIAVENAVDVLKSSADIVLLSHGIDVIKVALTEARKIFSRLYSYSVYRISESFRLVITVLVLGFLYANFPLTPIQLILLALLNDIPIITLAFNRVKHIGRPAERPVRERFVTGTLFGLVGVANSLLLFFLLLNVLKLPWSTIQTAFFLKLAVSGHMLIYVAHTRERWFNFLPSWSVIAATTLTQMVSTALAFFGLFVSPIAPALILFIWIWSFVWMQVTEAVKELEMLLPKKI